MVFALTAVMLGTTVPTPLYTLYADELDFSIGTSTMVFATYATGVIVALIGLGSWSDVVGRQPMLMAGLACAAASSAVFLTAGTLWQLLVGRALSGLSAGIFTGTATAAIIETAPTRWRNHAVVVATIANMGGLGLGPILSGLLAQYSPWPLHLVFAVHLVMIAGAGCAVGSLTETSTSPPGARLRLQRLSIPPETRPVFLRAAPATFAGFSVMGLFTAVVPTFMNRSLHIDNTVTAGLVVAALFVGSAAAQTLTRALPVTAALISGCAALVLAMGLIGPALVSGSLTMLIIGAIIAGAGQGATFTRGLSAVVDAAPITRQGEIASSYFIVAYVAISAPVLGVGIAAQQWGLPRAGLVFTIIVAILAALSLLGTTLAARIRPASKSHSATRRAE